MSRDLGVGTTTFCNQHHGEEKSENGFVFIFASIRAIVPLLSTLAPLWLLPPTTPHLLSVHFVAPRCFYVSAGWFLILVHIGMLSGGFSLFVIFPIPFFQALFIFESLIPLCFLAYFAHPSQRCALASAIPYDRLCCIGIPSVSPLYYALIRFCAITSDVFDELIYYMYFFPSRSSLFPSFFFCLARYANMK